MWDFVDFKRREVHTHTHTHNTYRWSGGCCSIWEHREQTGCGSLRTGPPVKSSKLRIMSDLHQHRASKDGFVFPNFDDFLVYQRYWRSVKVYLGVKPRILIGVADVDREACGRHQLCYAVVNQPVRIRWLFHTVLETVKKKKIQRRRWNTAVQLIIEPCVKHTNAFAGWATGWFLPTDSPSCIDLNLMNFLFSRYH